MINWVGVYTVNSATYRAGVGAGGLEKTWITMHDDAVRSMHSAVDGQTVPIRGTFDVGGNKLLFPGEPVGPPEVWINCRCLVAVTGGEEMGTKTTSFAVATEEEAEELTDEQLADEDLVDDDISTPWHGVLVLEGVPTGDKRQFDIGALTYRDFPLPLKFQRASAEGHLGDVVIGTIDSITKVDNEHRAVGRLNLNVPEANEVVDGLVFGMFRGVSIEIDDAEFELDFPENEEDEDDIMGMLFGGAPELTRFTKARITGATVVATPAFMEAYVALGDSFDEELRDPNAGVADAGEVDGDTEYSDEVVAEWSFETLDELVAWLSSDDEGDPDKLDEHYSLVASAFAPGTHDGPGWITHPRATQRLRSYWVHGEGAAKIRWGTPGDFNRCRKQLGKYVNPAFLAGTCANLHKEAIKVWPGRERGNKRHSVEETAPAFSLTASASFEVEPEDIRFFSNPELSALQPLTIDPDGRIYGYVAAWGTCHIGIGEKCVMPPHSETEYAHFLRGITETTEGPVRTGAVVMWTGHAGTRQSAIAATQHYDNTGDAVADVTVGEDALGIWFSGKLRDNVTAEDIKVLRASGTVSGDWRDPMQTGVPREMVGLLAVNVGGFPMPRVAFAMDGDKQVSLIASAGILAPATEVKQEEAKFITAADLDTKLAAVGRIVADELEYRAERRERLSKLRDPELDKAVEERRLARIAAAKELE